MADSRIDELRHRLERDPGSRLFAQLAEEHRKAGDHVEAIRVARAGLALHPAYPSARLTLGRALLDSGDPEGARAELEAALRDAPDNILASRFLGQALQALGEHEPALLQLEKTLKMAPGDRQLEAQIASLVALARAARSAVTLPAPSRGGPFAPAPPPARGAQSPTPAPLAAQAPPVASRPPDPPPLPAPAILRHEAGRDAGARVPRAAPAEAETPTARAGAVSVEETVFEHEGEPEAEALERAAAAGWAADAAAERAPFPSSTLAELYFRQGLPERAAEVYRQVLAEEPGNERARARLAEIERAEPQDPRAARRLALERTISGLEALLGAIRARRRA